jgi:solute carrier family 6 amino acid/orphan transporter-like 15/16/17/18/20
MNQFPFPNVWAIIFFLMLFTLGIDSQFGTMQGVVQCIVDLKLFPNVRKEILTGQTIRNKLQTKNSTMVASWVKAS